MYKKIKQYRMLCFVMVDHASWLAFSFALAIFTSAMLVGLQHGVAWFTVCALFLLYFNVYCLVAPVIGYWTSLKVIHQYGPKTLQAIYLWIESDNRPPEINIEIIAHENGEFNKH